MIVEAGCAQFSCRNNFDTAQLTFKFDRINFGFNATRRCFGLSNHEEQVDLLFKGSFASQDGGRAVGRVQFS